MPFAVGWRRYIPAIVVSLALVLGGCTGITPALRKLYFLSVSYQPMSQSTAISANLSSTGFLSYVANATQQSGLEVRGAFFGICVHQTHTVQSNIDWDCGTLSDMQTKYREQYPALDPLGLVEYTSRFCSEVVFYGLFIASTIVCAVVFSLLATFPGWHTTIDSSGSEHEVKPFPSMVVSQFAMFATAVAVAFSFVSTIWVHVGAVSAAGTLDFVFNGLVATNVGWLPLFFCWSAVFLQGSVLLGIIVMIQSIRLLDRLLDEDD